MKEIATIRRGEELDEVRLRAYLEQELGHRGESLSIKQFPAGSSNLTYLLEVDGNEYVLRRPPFGNRVETAHDMSREFSVLSALAKASFPAPKPVSFCEDDEVIGAPFYLMERKDGLIVRGTLPSTVDGSQATAKKIAGRFIKTLADLHSVDYHEIGLESFGRPEGYVARQVVGWSQRYFNAKTDQWDELEEAIFWLNNNIPENADAALIHNDYKFDNVMFRDKSLSEVSGVLDWEMATVGSPLMDLGTTLGYWMSSDAGEEMLSMPFNPRMLMENVSRRDLADYYGEAVGREMPDLHYYYIFGTMKIAVIAQQIYFRFKKGFTRDPRFATFDRLVGKLGKLGYTAVQRGSV